MYEEFTYPIPQVDLNEGRLSPVLDKFGKPFVVKEVKQPIGFKLWK